MLLNEKIDTLLHNNEWTQACLAEQLHVHTSTVQKWVKGNNQPTIDTVKELSSIFYISLENLLDDDYEIIKFIKVDKYLPYDRLCFPKRIRDHEHIIIDAGLEGNAMLHRYLDAADNPCSSIYQYGREVWWHYREHERRMIRDWNEWGYR